MTSNLLGEEPYERYSRIDAGLRPLFSTRILQCIETIKKQEPDLIMLQELDKDWGKWLWKALNKTYSFVFDHTKEGNTQMAFMYKKTTIKLSGTSHLEQAAKILSQQFIERNTGKSFLAIVIHAPWGQGGIKSSYQKRYEHYLSFTTKRGEKIPVIAMGDWNTDGSPEQNNNKEIFKRIFDANNYIEHTKNLPFTARGTNNSDKTQCIDYIMTAGFKEVIPAKTVPTLFQHLLIHSPIGTIPFDVNDSNNHYSDHAAVIVDLEIADTGEDLSMPKPATSALEKPTSAIPLVIKPGISETPQSESKPQAVKPTPKSKHPEKSKLPHRIAGMGAFLFLAHEIHTKAKGKSYIKTMKELGRTIFHKKNRATLFAGIALLASIGIEVKNHMK